MYEIISVLRQSAIVLDFDVLELIDEDSVKLIKIKAVLKENWLLYITELHTKDYQKYSYHCQKNDGELIARWDNKPHWSGMSTYPHHKHENDQVSPSHRVTIVDVLDQIEEKIAVNKKLIVRFMEVEISSSAISQKRNRASGPGRHTRTQTDCFPLINSPLE